MTRGRATAIGLVAVLIAFGVAPRALVDSRTAAGDEILRNRARVQLEQPAR